MDNRQLIMNSALTLFYESGYDAVGVQQIVDSAGVSKPTLYYYFGSKQGLLEALLNEHFQPMEQKLIEASETGKNNPRKTVPHRACLLQRSLRRPEIPYADDGTVLFRKKKAKASAPYTL